MTFTIIYIAILSPLANIFLGLSMFKSLSKEMRIFVSYQIAIFTIDCTIALFAENGWNNLTVIHGYFFVQFVMLSFFYFTLFRSRQQQTAVGVISICAGVLETINLLFLTDDLFEFSNLEIFLCSFPPIIYAVMHFYNMLDQEKRYQYISAGVLTYLFSSTVIFLSGNLLNEMHVDDDYVRITNSLMYIGYQILIFVNLRKLRSEYLKIGRIA